MLPVYSMVIASPLSLLMYLLASILVGIYGRNTRIGYWGFVILSVVVTPIPTFLFLYFSAPKKKARMKRA